jgi:hypothetical protein
MALRYPSYALTNIAVDTHDKKPDVIAAEVGVAPWSFLARDRRRLS